MGKRECNNFGGIDMGINDLGNLTIAHLVQVIILSLVLIGCFIALYKDFKGWILPLISELFADEEINKNERMAN